MKRRRLGQHYLVDDTVADALVARGGIVRGDMVVEIGAGRGVLTTKLMEVGAKLVSYEVDEENMEQVRGLVGGDRRVELRLADAFGERPRFDVLVTSLPYSESSRFVEWLATMSYRTASVLLQDDFAEKILAPPGDRSYRGISVIAQMSATITLGPRVGRDAFDPPPKVASRMVTLLHRRTLTEPQVALTKKMFGLRRRRLSAVSRTLGLPEAGLGDVRVFGLSPEQVYELISGRCGA
jgi:16S rRNA A1518/A1519 N6-dimethyltransferase RsmA/KsgA/DIM1 with predicted DNA glycosylase/AP lyase activity